MSTIKVKVIEWIQALPDDCTLEDIRHHLDIRAQAEAQRGANNTAPRSQGSPEGGKPASPGSTAVPAAPQPGGGPGEGPDNGKLTPELLEWARQQFTEAEIVAELRELREKGGLELH